MPKIDPHTGCTVMTQSEFWAAEATREGKGRSGADLEGDMFEDMERERVAEEKRLRDPKVAYKLLRAACRRDIEGGAIGLPMITAVREVLEVRVDDNLRGGGLFLRARALRSGVEDIIELDEWHTSGSMSEPPDGESSLLWENLDDDGEPIEWRHLYTVTGTPEKPRHDTEARRKKVAALYKSLKLAVRVRIHNNELQVNEKQVDEAYRALGLLLVHLDPFNPLWNCL